jgi:peptidoglycan glycosyltransferase
MNKRISRLGVGLILCYVLLFLQLNRIQVLQADKLNRHPENFRQIQRDFDRPRGAIATADGVVVARSVDTPGEPYERLRVYPEGELFAHVTGFFSLEYGADGVELSYNDELAGLTPGQQYDRLSDLFVNRDRTGDVFLTLRSDLQEVARQALGDRKGSVVLLDPASGAILALWSWPSYDPNLLSSHNLQGVRDSRDFYLAQPDQPMLARTYRERFFPGSTFKVVTASTGVQSGLVTPPQPVYPVSSGYVPPASTSPIRNFGGGSCGGALFAILAVSCNTAFAQMGAETLGPDLMIDGAASWGFNSRPPLDLPDPAVSLFPTDFGAPISGKGGPGSVYENSAALAQAAIGQNDVQATPLQMALVAAGVANDGRVPTPHVAADVRDREGAVIQTVAPGPWRTAIAPQAAATMRAAMVNVVEQGTAKGLARPGWTVGAKTGTAEITPDGSSSNAWVVGFAGPEGKPPALAFVAMVEAAPSAGEQTGSQVAVPIARQLLDGAGPFVDSGR